MSLLIEGRFRRANVSNYFDPRNAICGAQNGAELKVFAYIATDLH